MQTYELINPSDEVTFKAENDKLAYVVALLVGNGKTPCRKISENGDEIEIPSFLLFSENADKDINNYLECSLSNFIENNRPKLKKTLETFCYLSPKERKTYDDAINSITDINKLKEFKNQHEDQNRTSTSEFVKKAWELAEQINK